MPPSKTAPTLVDAVQSVFAALEPFDEVARQRILASVTSLFGGQAPPGAGPAQMPLHPPAPALPRPGPERRLSPVELLQEKQPATNPQRIAVFAHYRERSEGLTRFSKDDLEPYFAKAHFTRPQNFDRDYRQAVKEGWIYDDGADSYLTSRGMEAVEAGFSGKGAPRGAAVAKKGRSKPRRNTKSRKRK